MGREVAVGASHGRLGAKVAPLQLGRKGVFRLVEPDVFAALRLYEAEPPMPTAFWGFVNLGGTALIAPRAFLLGAFLFTQG